MKIFSLYRKLPSSNFSVPAELKKYLQLSYFAVPHLIPLSSNASHAFFLLILLSSSASSSSSSSFIHYIKSPYTLNTTNHNMRFTYSSPHNRFSLRQRSHTFFTSSKNQDYYFLSIHFLPSLEHPPQQQHKHIIRSRPFFSSYFHFSFTYSS